MTAIYMDGFDHYGVGAQSTSTMQQGPYAASGIICTTPTWGPARTGDFCLQANATSLLGNRYVFSTSQSHLFMSFGYAVDNLPGQNGTHWIVNFLDNSNNIISYLTVESTGALSLRDSGGSVLAVTSGPVVKARNWHFFELEYNGSSGAFHLHVDDIEGSGSAVLSGTVTTGSVFQLGLLQAPLANQDQTIHYMDDLFIRNASGSTNNSFLGDRRIGTLFAAADTATSGWTPSYYQRFGAGILRLSYLTAGSTTVVNPSAFVHVAGSIPALAALDIGAADFTWESQVRFDSVPAAANYSTIFTKWDGANNLKSYRFILGGQTFNGGCLQFDTSTDGTNQTNKITFPWVPDTDVWYHLALVRVSGELLLFINGEQQGLPVSDTDTYWSGGAEPYGQGNEITNTNSAVANTNFIGRMDETRFTNGVGRYNADFTPPVAAFPRGGSDPDWSQVVLLMGYDSGIVDESSFSIPIHPIVNGAISFQPGDGPAVGVYSTVNKPTPDDNTFISASLTNAFNILTMTTQPSNGDTVTVGTTDGTTTAVYTFKTSISSAYDVLIDTTAQNSLTNLLNAINAGPGIGTKYGTGTVSNFDVQAVSLPAGQIEVVALIAGTGGNAIASTTTGTHASFPTTTLAGGVDIPGPTQFKFQRPPNNTTVISALQMTVRALKTDAGTATIQTSFIGPLGTEEDNTPHNLTISANYYSDMLEDDPDTSGPISPTTIVNGAFQINRTA